MKATTIRFKQWWGSRNARERAMLVAMCIALAAFAWWYGLLMPLRLWREHARTRYDHAAAAWQATRANATAIAALVAAQPRNRETLAATVLDSAREAGIAVSRQRSDAQGRFVVDIDAVDAVQLQAWLDALQSKQRIAPQAVAIGKRDGRLHAELGFAAAAVASQP